MLNTQTEDQQHFKRNKDYCRHGKSRKVKHGGNGVRSDDVISSLKKCLQAIVLTMQVAIELNDKLFNRTFVIKNNRVPISLRKHEV